MDTSANLLIEELNAILADHKSQIIDMIKEDIDLNYHEALLVDVEANLNRMITDAKELFNSSYQ